MFGPTISTPGAPQPFPVQIEQVRRPVQPDRGLTGARRALHADRVVQLGPDQLVLLGLDGGDDVAHRPDAGPLDLRGQDAAAGAQLLAAVQVLVLEAGQLALDEAEPAPGRDALRVAHAGPVERPGQRRPPVEHHRLAGVVGDVPPPDVVRASRRCRAGRRTAAVVGSSASSATRRDRCRPSSSAVYASPATSVAGGEERLGAVRASGAARPGTRSGGVRSAASSVSRSDAGTGHPQTGWSQAARVSEAGSAAVRRGDVRCGACSPRPSSGPPRYAEESRRPHRITVASVRRGRVRRAWCSAPRRVAWWPARRSGRRRGGAW